MLPIIFGLSSALLWGGADFFGGLASRKGKAYQAVLLGEAIGLAVLLIIAFASGESAAPWQSWLLCSAAGSLGVIGLLFFFQSMTRGQMSIAAPVSALMAVVIPVIVGTFLEGFPGWMTFGGFGLALVAIWLISSDGGPKSLRLRLADLTLPLLAGVMFGIYLILMERGSQNNTFWPMVASRSAGTVTMLAYALFTRQGIIPPRSTWLLSLFNGLLDISGNAMFVLAGQVGRMDVAAVLVSLYPASTVVLAGLFLHERLNRLQWLGILAALAAIVLITI